MSSQNTNTLKESARRENERKRDEQKKILWNSRVALIKKGQLQTKNNLFGDAAVTYEKYIKILELIYECGSNGLTPEMLKESARTNELSVVAGIYWDLVRIYDSNPQFIKRQKIAAEKLAKFAVFTPLYHDLMKRASAFQKQARQPDIIKQMISAASKDKPRCFIATSAFNSPFAFEVQQMRIFRDQNLKENYLGRQFIFYYYKFSPMIAAFLDKFYFFKPLVRFFIRILLKIVT